ncbi:hypothetical protein CYG49_02830 [Candidatus Saccharibacteria bacterium]|nr:MAG: hypothetical protein CYG49_02830 [Candidatus Saccharibacteria bacterium]
MTHTHPIYNTVVVDALSPLSTALTSFLSIYGSKIYIKQKHNFKKVTKRYSIYIEAQDIFIAFHCLRSSSSTLDISFHHRVQRHLNRPYQ